MKTLNKFLLSIVAGTILCTSCTEENIPESVVVEGEKPTASFTAKSDPDDPQTIHFTNASQNIQSVYWQFGDNTTDTELSPTHRYAISGIYQVILKTKSQAGYMATDTLEVVAAGPAIAGFAYTQYSLQVKLKNTSSGAESLLWDFGDGATSTEDSPVHDYQQSGTYTITLTAHGIGGDTSTHTETVTVLKNYVQGGDMEDGSYWTVIEGANWYPICYYEFGSAIGAPTDGSGGSLRLWWDETGSGDALNAGCNVYQAVTLEQGKKYKFSALVKKNPGKNCVFQFYITETPVASGSVFAQINGYLAGCDQVPVDGNIMENACAGTGIATNGVFTATNATMYVFIHLRNYQGRFGGDVLIDDIAIVDAEE